MKNFRLIGYCILLFIFTANINSCNKPEGKDPSKSNQSANGIADTPKVASPTPSANSENKIVLKSSNGVMPSLPQPTDAQRLAPVGSVPLLRPGQLAEFHPRLPDFNLSKAKVVDEKKEAQSIILFRMRSDTARTIKSTIIDVNELGASKLIKEMAQIQKAGHETRVVEGEPITSYFTEIKGMPAIKAFIPSKSVATLYVLVGDHRAVVLREEKVTSADHLIQAAKTIDFKKFETLSRN